MESGGRAGRGATPVDHALDALSTALDHLVKVVEDGALDGYDQAGLLGFARSFEQVRRRSGLVDHRLVRDLETRRVAETLAQPSTGALLAWLLRISRGEAGRRVRAAEQLGERVTMTGEPLPPLRPALADGGAGRGRRARAGRHLPARTRERGPPRLRPRRPRRRRRAARRVRRRRSRPPSCARSPPGSWTGSTPTAPSRPTGSTQDRRHLALRTTRDGMVVLEGRLTGAVGAKLRAVLSPLAAPRPQTVVLEDGREVSEPDPRHHGQRMHDALEEVCDRLLRSGTLPDTGGIPSTVILTIPEADLAAQARWGVTSDGTVLSADTARTLADQAEVWPTVVNSRGVVLRMGRTRRLATPGQTVALIARDGGCSFPGCQRPPEWCELVLHGSHGHRHSGQHDHGKVSRWGPIRRSSRTRLWSCTAEMGARSWTWRKSSTCRPPRSRTGPGQPRNAILLLG